MSTDAPLVLAEPERPFWGFAEILLSVAAFVCAAFIGLTAAPYLHLNPQLGLPLLLIQFFGYVVVFAVLRLLFARYHRPLLRSLAWVPQRFGIGPLAAVGFTLSIFVVLLGSLLRLPETQTPFDKLLSDPASRITIAIFGITAGPVVEELLFRGFLQPVLVSSVGVFPGILATSALFGVMHLSQNAFIWQSGLLITLVGFVLGTIRHVSGSTRASAITHVAYNSVPFIILLFSKNSS